MKFIYIGSCLASRIGHPQLQQVLVSMGIDAPNKRWKIDGSPQCPLEHLLAAVLGVTRSPTASTGAPPGSRVWSHAVAHCVTGAPSGSRACSHAVDHRVHRSTFCSQPSTRSFPPRRPSVLTAFI
ncbi:uncharacterized protein [Drosophila suzukii]|uniref:Uncharacterized protein n=1 Tax=Drosophila suzukii TaxID=28584 RepID=A0AB40AFN0_DROSZ|nr:uncharacterized protein LOC118879737 [Drosophila suzukii]